MEIKTVEERVYSTIQEVLKIGPEQISLKAKVREDLGAASLDLIVLMMALEQEFNGSISDENAATMSTVEDIVLFIKKNLIPTA